MALDRLPRVLNWTAELDELTFSRWQALQVCPAKALSDRLVLDGTLPKMPPSRAMLVGRFHHSLMERVTRALSIEQLDQEIEEAIGALQQEVARWPHLKRGGTVSGWSEVNRSASQALRAFPPRTTRAVAESHAEQMLRSRSGILVGRPDRFFIAEERATLIEYKTGSLRDEVDAIKPHYLEQLTFYAALIFDSYDVQFVMGVLESLQGDRYERDVSREHAQALCERVHSTLASFNTRARSAPSFADLATPSADGCSTCELRCVCPTFKRKQDELALIEEVALAEGTLTKLCTTELSAASTLTLNDRLRQTELTLSLPRQVASQLSVHREYQLLNLRRRGRTLEWGLTSQALRYD